MGRRRRRISRLFRRSARRRHQQERAAAAKRAEEARAAKARNDRRLAEEARKKKAAESGAIPPLQTLKDFSNVTPTGPSGLTFEDHWNPRDGWRKDLNKDGVVDLEDFKLAVYPEHKAYIRDWILSHQFDRNKYLDVNQDGKVDMDDYFLAKDDNQKRTIRDYVKEQGGCLTGNRIHGVVLHMVDANEKEFIFSAQDEPETGLVGKSTGAIIRNIHIDETHEYHEAVKKFGKDIGRPIIRGVQWEGDDDQQSIKMAIQVIKEKLPDRYSKFFDVVGFPRRLRGERGTIFRITKREDSQTVDVKEIQPKADESGYVLVLSGDFEYGKKGEEFLANEELQGIGNLKGMVRAGIKKPNTKDRLDEIKKRKTARIERTTTGGSRARLASSIKKASPRRRRRRRRWGGLFRRRRRGGIFRRRRRRRRSDIRLKRNINYISTSPSGLNVYEYNYLWSNKKYRGVMAQELLDKFPRAVSKSFGFYNVDYDMIDVKFEEIKNG